MIKFTYLAIILLTIEFLIFWKFSNPKQKDKKKKVIMDSLTFNSGLILFLYLFGTITSINYFTNIDEFLLLAAIFIAAIYLISIADEYYKNIRNKIKRSAKKWRKKKDGTT